MVCELRSFKRLSEIEQMHMRIVEARTHKASAQVFACGFRVCQCEYLIISTYS